MIDCYCMGPVPKLSPRSFVGANQSEANVDLLLGPGNFQFRKAAVGGPRSFGVA